MKRTRDTDLREREIDETSVKNSTRLYGEKSITVGTRRSSFLSNVEKTYMIFGIDVENNVSFMTNRNIQNSWCKVYTEI